MLTNLLVSVVISLHTNVSSDSLEPRHSIHDWDSPYRYASVPTTIKQTHEVVETKTFEFTFEGKPYKLSNDKVLSSVTKTLQRREEWKEVNTVTNTVIDWDDPANRTNRVILWFSTNRATFVATNK